MGLIILGVLFMRYFLENSAAKRKGSSSGTFWFAVVREACKTRPRSPKRLDREARCCSLCCSSNWDNITRRANISLTCCSTGTRVGTTCWPVWGTLPYKIFMSEPAGTDVLKNVPFTGACSPLEIGNRIPVEALFDASNSSFVGFVVGRNGML